MVGAAVENAAEGGAKGWGTHFGHVAAGANALLDLSELVHGGGEPRVAVGAGDFEGFGERRGAEDLDIPERGAFAGDGHVLDGGGVFRGDDDDFDAFARGAADFAGDAADGAGFPVGGQVAGGGAFGVEIDVVVHREEEQAEGGGGGGAVLGLVLAVESDGDGAVVVEDGVADVDGAEGFVEGVAHEGANGGAEGGRRGGGSGFGGGDDFHGRPGGVAAAEFQDDEAVDLGLAAGGFARFGAVSFGDGGRDGSGRP